MRKQGFTLIELLVVMAIIAILASVFAGSSVRAIRNAQLRDATTQVASDFKRARSTAQRSSANVVLSLPKTTPQSTYTVKVGSGTARSYTLPDGIKIVCKTNCGSGATTTITYNAPYAELAATGSSFTVSSPYPGITPLEIRLVGVTGKVMIVNGS